MQWQCTQWHYNTGSVLVWKQNAVYVLLHMFSSTQRMSIRKTENNAQRNKKLNSSIQLSKEYLVFAISMAAQHSDSTPFSTIISTFQQSSHALNTA
jgi:hypothetical protein